MVGRDFTVDDFDYVSIMQNTSAGSRNVFGFADPISELQSYFVRGIFNLKDKYLLTATMRADGSSKFGANNKYGYFPAVGAAWNIHSEDFLQDGPFSNLKLRLGWGQTGNSEFPAGAAIERFAFGQGTFFQVNADNPDVKWETTTTLNVGLDFSVLRGRLNGTIEYFNRNTKDLLFQNVVAQPGPDNLRYWENLPGNVINSGVELTLDAQVVNGKEFSWNLGGNVAFLNNVLENFTGAPIDYGQLFGQGITGATSQRFANGQPLNSFYLRRHLGIGADGQSMFADGEPLEFVGDPNPNVLLGVSTTVSYNKLSLNLNFNGAMGHQIFNNTKVSVIPIGNLGTRNIDANLVNNGGNREAISNAIKASDRYLEDGSYVKLANATLSYNLGNIGKSVKNAQVYLTGQNLLLFTNYTGFDPEVNTVNTQEGLPSSGIEYIPYPSARTIILGANFSF
jgi:TonB dependent receptor.